MAELTGLIAEMRRRRVFRGAGLAVLVAWLVYIAVRPTGDLAVLACWLFLLAVIASGVFSWLFRVRPGEFALEEHGGGAPPSTPGGRMLDGVVAVGMAVVAFVSITDLVNATEPPSAITRQAPSTLFMQIDD